MRFNAGASALSKHGVSLGKFRLVEGIITGGWGCIRLCLPENVGCVHTDTAVPVTINEMLLRGCMLQNSGHVLGVVVYTGARNKDSDELCKDAFQNWCVW